MTTPDQLKTKRKVLKDLFETDGYVKGYGKYCRVMDGKHNPLYNVEKQIISSLYDDGNLRLEGLIYKLNL